MRWKDWGLCFPVSWLWFVFVSVGERSSWEWAWNLPSSVLLISCVRSLRLCRRKGMIWFRSTTTSLVFWWLQFGCLWHYTRWCLGLSRILSRGFCVAIWYSWLNCHFFSSLVFSWSPLIQQFVPFSLSSFSELASSLAFRAQLSFLQSWSSTLSGFSLRFWWLLCLWPRPEISSFWSLL